jgi:ArsR family transcriptional regulator
MIVDIALDIEGCQYKALPRGGLCEEGALWKKELWERRSMVKPALDPSDCCSLLATPITAGEAAELAKAFQALADPVRLQLLSLIAGQDEGEVCACALVEPVGKSQPTVSHHLKVLYDAGLVDREKRGTWVWYWVVPDRLEALRAALAPGARVGA